MTKCTFTNKHAPRNNVDEAAKLQHQGNLTGAIFKLAFSS